MNSRRYLIAAFGLVCASALTACDNGPSAVRSRDRNVAEGSRGDSPAPAGRDGGYQRTDRGERARPASRPREVVEAADALGGGLKWAASAKHSADDNAHFQFDKRASDFGISNFKAYVSKADDFVAHPPEGVLKAERANGDTLMYDPKANIFAVADKAGAPRILFKPADGMAYWDDQKAKLERRRQKASDSADRG